MKYCLLVCLLLAGCAKPHESEVVVHESEVVVPDTQNFVPEDKWWIPSWKIPVSPITLPDGTRCVAATASTTGVAITCDWSKTK